MSILGAANGRVHFKDGNAVDYARFGRGPRVLIMLPGVGDGLKTAEGMALPMAVLYRELAEDFTVYMISRRRELLLAEALADCPDTRVRVTGITENGTTVEIIIGGESRTEEVRAYGNV